MSRRTGRRRILRAGALVAVTVALLLAAGGPASAAPELGLSPDRGPVGSTFTITGTGFPAAEVEIHWATQTGQPLATATGPDFTIEGRVPANAQPDAYRVVAVVRSATGTSTSSASFQVTLEPGTETTTTSTPTTVPATTTTVEVTETTAAPPPASPTGGRSSSLTGGLGGLDGGLPDTTTGLDEPGTSPAGIAGAGTGAGAGAGVGVGAGTGAGTAPSEPASPTSIAPLAGATPPGAPAAPPGGVVDGAAPGLVPNAGVGGPGDLPGASGGDVGEGALAPRSTSQSSGAIRNPALLAAGLGMVFTAGVILAIRNRQRTGTPSG